MRKAKIVTLLSLLLLVGLSSQPALAQRFALKTNLIWDATLTPNLAFEAGLSKHSTVQLAYGLNPWELGNGKQAKHWQLIPEYRWWPCSKFNGHFVGIHAMGGQFNMAKMDLKLPFTGWPSDLKSKRYEGWNVGGGITYGYQWILGKRWNLEASIGVGYQHIKYKKYPCATCGTMIDEGRRNYFGPTKAVIDIAYIF